MDLTTAFKHVVIPALEYLPRRMDSDKARVMLLAIGLQESGFEHRDQLDSSGMPGLLGPALGFWQFEKGTASSRGGVVGVMMHPTSRYWLHALCEAFAVEWHAKEIWRRLKDDDVFACCVARLLLFTDPQPLPYDVETGWRYYKRLWRPGKPKPDKWPGFFMQAYDVVHGGSE